MGVGKLGVGKVGVGKMGVGKVGYDRSFSDQNCLICRILKIRFIKAIVNLC
jgi:hypothetical protein